MNGLCESAAATPAATWSPQVGEFYGFSGNADGYLGGGNDESATQSNNSFNHQSGMCNIYTEFLRQHASDMTKTRNKLRLPSLDPRHWSPQETHAWIADMCLQDHQTVPPDHVFNFSGAEMANWSEAEFCVRLNQQVGEKISGHLKSWIVGLEYLASTHNQPQMPNVHSSRSSSAGWDSGHSTDSESHEFVGFDGTVLHDFDYYGSAAMRPNPHADFHSQPNVQIGDFVGEKAYYDLSVGTNATVPSPSHSDISSAGSSSAPDDEFADPDAQWLPAAHYGHGGQFGGAAAAQWPQNPTLYAYAQTATPTAAAAAPVAAPIAAQRSPPLMQHAFARGAGSVHLWHFIRELLDHPKQFSSCVRWVNRDEGTFKIESSNELAKLWGQRKNRCQMNYDKLSRSLRQYYKKGIIQKPEKKQRLVYRFLPPYNQ